MNSTQFPISRNITLLYTLSLILGLLMAGVSVAGLFFQSNLYPTVVLRRSFVPNDVVNLIIGLPILFGSLWLTQCGRLIGLLFWPGALFYIIYNYIAYAVAMPSTVQFVVYLAMVALSIYAIVTLLYQMDRTAIQQRLAGGVHERLAGGVLVGAGALFFLRGVSQVVSALTGQAVSAGPDLAVLVADLLTTPAWVVGGVLLWRRQTLGYAAGLGLLFQASMLFIGLLVFFILQPFLSTTPFPLANFVVILVMGLVCFIPFGLFVRGVITKS